MAKQNKQNGMNGASGDDAREQLAAGWGKMTASMVSPGSGGNGSSGGGKARAGGKGSAPLPISALPLPAEDLPSDEPEPAHSLPTNSEGKLSPAQRARLGLDLYGEDAVAAAQPAPVAPPPAEPVPEPGPAGQQQAAPSEFDFNGIDPYSQEAGQQADPAPAGARGPAAIAPQSAQQPGFAPISDEPRLVPVSNEPKLAPVSQPAQQRRRESVERDDEPRRRAPAKQKRAIEGDTFEAIQHDRSVLSYGFAWTAFAIVVTAGIAFSSSLSSDPASATGPGPMIPGLISIAMGWVIVLAARGMGRGWGVLMVIPALILFIGPYMYRAYWSTSVEESARSYLSPTGAKAQIDVDATSVVSETVNTDRGCFGVTRTRSNNDTQVSIVTYLPTTARQQADYALAPRYAGRVPAGGERATQRIFTFKNGRAPAAVQVPREPPLDCANAITSPGTGADPAAAEAQDALN